VLLVRLWVLEHLRHPRWAQANDIVNRFAVPLFLFHTTGYAIAFGLLWLTGYRPPSNPSLAWRAQRPIWLVVPLLCTIPVVLVFGRRIGGARRPVPVPAPQPPPPARPAGDRRLPIGRRPWPGRTWQGSPAGDADILGCVAHYLEVGRNRQGSRAMHGCRYTASYKDG
jgi:hypothetical protein